jgi:phosphotransferase system enzyme I (PtsI)
MRIDDGGAPKGANLGKPPGPPPGANVAGVVKRGGPDPHSNPPATGGVVPDRRSAVARDRPHVTLTGIPVAPGIAIGPVHLVVLTEFSVPEGQLAEGEIDAELERFRQAVEKSREEVTFLRGSVAEDMGEDSAKIFDAQLLFLEDVMVVDAVADDVRRERKPAAAIFRRNVRRMIERLEDADDEYLRERAGDFRDIKLRLMRHLLEHREDRRARPPGAVLVGREIAPSEAAMLDRNGAVGFATELGGMTSHAAIMARSKGVPAVVGVKGLTRHARSGDLAIIDGLGGAVVLNPPAALLAEYEQRMGEFREFEGSLITLRDEPAVTVDGRRIELAANLESPADVDRVLERGADSVGLYRTEFFYIDHARMPDEAEQFQAYCQVVERMYPRPVIIRTMDLGGDKVASYLGATRESNPFLGWRGIRFSLEHRDVFRTQLRAIYRASRCGKVKLMLPMVTSIDEVRDSRTLARDVVAELIRDGVPHGDEVEFGIMIETPSAVMIADILAREVDFFSVGSNDLIQYTLAADRSNPKTASLYQPLHPAILRSLRNVVDAARAEKIWVGVCGEMAADPLAVVLLVGLGFDELSVSPFLVPEVKTVVRSITYADARAVAEEAVELESAAAVRTLTLSRMGKLLPQFLLP